jgi:hypothetical protein
MMQQLQISLVCCRYAAGRMYADRQTNTVEAGLIYADEVSALLQQQWHQLMSMTPQLQYSWKAATDLA